MGGGMNMASLMKQAQKMQEKMQEQQKEMGTKTFTGTAGGGAVTATVSGLKEVKSIVLDKDAVDPDDVEMLQDMIVAAVNEALRKVDDENKGMLNGLL